MREADVAVPFLPKERLQGSGLQRVPSPNEPGFASGCPVPRVETAADPIVGFGPPGALGGILVGWKNG